MRTLYGERAMIDRIAVDPRVHFGLDLHEFISLFFVQNQTSEWQSDDVVENRIFWQKVSASNFQRLKFWNSEGLPVVHYADNDFGALQSGFEICHSHFSKV